MEQRSIWESKRRQERREKDAELAKFAEYWSNRHFSRLGPPRSTEEILREAEQKAINAAANAKFEAWCTEENERKAREYAANLHQLTLGSVPSVQLSLLYYSALDLRTAALSAFDLFTALYYSDSLPGVAHHDALAFVMLVLARYLATQTKAEAQCDRPPTLPIQGHWSEARWRRLSRSGSPPSTPTPPSASM